MMEKETVLTEALSLSAKDLSWLLEELRHEEKQRKMIYAHEAMRRLHVGQEVVFVMATRSRRVPGGSPLLEQGTRGVVLRKMDSRLLVTFQGVRGHWAVYAHEVRPVVPEEEKGDVTQEA